MRSAATTARRRVASTFSKYCNSARRHGRGIASRRRAAGGAMLVEALGPPGEDVPPAFASAATVGGGTAAPSVAGVRGAGEGDEGGTGARSRAQRMLA